MKAMTEDGREGKKEEECRREIKSECCVDVVTGRQREETMPREIHY